jgi:hypothetical protein
MAGRRQQAAERQRVAGMSAWNQGDLDALEQAIVAGHRSVKYADKEVQYRSLDEMIKIRDMVKRSLSPNKDDGKRYGVVTRGLSG